MPSESLALLGTGLGNKAQHQHSSEAREQGAHKTSLGAALQDSKQGGHERGEAGQAPLVQRRENLLRITLNGGSLITAEPASCLVGHLRNQFLAIGERVSGPSHFASVV
jgi:hypothetical protein